VDISRIERMMKNPRFLLRCFSEREREQLAGRGAKSVAANLAGKEAVLKCLGLGIFDLPLAGTEILRDERGAPFVELSGKARELAYNPAETIFISLSHEREMAIAMAVREERGI